MYDICLKNANAYIDNKFINTNIYIKNSIISNISSDFLDSSIVYDLYNKHLIPGIIDPHVHFQLNCGKYTSVDDFHYGSLSAVYGGVTTFIDFLDPARNAEELELAYNRRLNEVIESSCFVDFKFHACLVNPNEDVSLFVDKMKELGLNTIKIFTTYSDSNRRTYDEDIIKLLKLSKQRNFKILVHAEKDELIKQSKDMSYKDLSCISRPKESEINEIIDLCELIKKHGGYLYIVHTSCGSSIQIVKEKYASLLNKNIFFESCPQYFYFNNDKLLHKDGHLFTFAPPLREEEELNKLNLEIENITSIGTDHCAFNKKDKEHELLSQMPLGVGGIEFSFPLMFTKFNEKIINKMTRNISSVFNIEGKGEIKVGNDADFAIFQLKENVISKTHGKCDYTIYEGQKINCEILSTMVRGKFILKDKVIVKQNSMLIRGDID